jgi:hypothetical protein
MNLHSWLAVVFVMLALAGCVQVTTEQQGRPPYTTTWNIHVTGAVTAAGEVEAAACSGRGKSDLARPLHRSRERNILGQGQGPRPSDALTQHPLGVQWSPYLPSIHFLKSG